MLSTCAFRPAFNGWEGLVTGDQAVRAVGRSVVTGDQESEHRDQRNLPTGWSGFWSGSSFIIPPRRGRTSARRHTAGSAIREEVRWNDRTGASPGR